MTRSRELELTQYQLLESLSEQWEQACLPLFLLLREDEIDTTLEILITQNFQKEKQDLGGCNLTFF